MQPLKAILVEDEASGMKNLQWKLSEYCPEIEVIAECTTGKKAIEMIRRYRPAVVFLDIHLGDMSGFEVLESIPFTAFKVIFTTSHKQHAIKAIKKRALDFLVKPIKKDDLIEAVQKLMEEPHQPSNIVSLPVSSGVRFEDVNNILYLETEGNRCKAVISEKGGIEEVKLTKLLGDMEQRLSRYGFGRPNQACLVNLRHIKESIRGDGGWVILRNQKHVNIGTRFRDKFFQRLNDWVIGV